MKKVIDLFAKFASVLSKIAGILLLIMSIGVCIHVILRGFFNSGIQGIYEFVQYTMLTIVSLTLAENELTGGNIIVNFVLDKFKPRTANIIEIVMYFLTIGGMIYVLYNQITMVFQKYATGGITGVLGIPHWILVLITCIGLFFFVLAFIVRVYNMIVGHKDIENVVLTMDEKAAMTEAKSEF